VAKINISHLFHGSFDNESPSVCFHASMAPSMLNKEAGFGEWMMPVSILILRMSSTSTGTF
jgi:hypothetical protein